MAKKNKSIDAGMLDDFILLKNILADDLKAKLTGFGYDDTRFAEGQTIFNAAEIALQTKKDAYGDKLQATRALYLRAKQVKKIFTNHVKIARRALADKENHIADLGITGKMSYRFANWTQKAIDFYNKALATPGILMELAVFGVTELKLQDGLTMLAEVKDLKAAQKDAIGIAQAATIDKNSALDALAKWTGDLVEICRIAFEDNLQLMERLNVLVYSPGYRKKTNDSETPEPPADPGTDPQEPPVFTVYTNRDDPLIPGQGGELAKAA